MQRLSWRPAAALLLLWAGCANDPYQLVTVTGKVESCNGMSPEGGTVVFTPIDAPDKTGRPAGNPGRPGRGLVKADGTFTVTTRIPENPLDGVPGVIWGPHEISFELPPTEKPVLLDSEANAMSAEEAAAIRAKFDKFPVYPKLDCADTVTPAQVEVSMDKENVFEFKLDPM